jgi:hypothetical protein
MSTRNAFFPMVHFKIGEDYSGEHLKSNMKKEISGMLKQDKAALLKQSDGMEPVQGVVEVDVPIEVLWDSFSQARHWPGWNKCFFDDRIQCAI